MSNNNGDANREAVDLAAKVEWALKQLDQWPDKAFDFHVQLPGPSLCPECYLAGHEPQRDHYILVLCPRATGFLTVYRQKDRLRQRPPEEADGKLYPDTVYAMDATTLFKTVVALIQKLYEHREEGA